MPRRIPKKFLIKIRNETTTTISSSKINQVINRQSEPLIHWTTLSKPTTIASTKNTAIVPFYSMYLIALIVVLIILAVVSIVLFIRLKKKRPPITLVPSDSTTTNGSENPLFNMQETTLNQQVPGDARNSQKNNVRKLKKSPSCTSHRLQPCDGLTTIPLN